MQHGDDDCCMEELHCVCHHHILTWVGNYLKSHSSAMKKKKNEEDELSTV